MTSFPWTTVKRLIYLAPVLGRGMISVKLLFLRVELIERYRRSESIATDITDSIIPDESVASAASSSHPKGKDRGKQTK
jgi:hypothetical protein